MPLPRSEITPNVQPGSGSGPGRRTEGPQAAMVLGGATPSDRADWDQLLEALLPDASEDPEVALSVAQMAREHLRHLKYERLMDLAAEIHQPSGPEGGVLVPFGKESQWLSGLDEAGFVDCIARKPANTIGAIRDDNVGLIP